MLHADRARRAQNARDRVASDAEDPAGHDVLERREGGRRETRGHSRDERNEGGGQQRLGHASSPRRSFLQDLAKKGIAGSIRGELSGAIRAQPELPAPRLAGWPRRQGKLPLVPEPGELRTWLYPTLLASQALHPEMKIPPERGRNFPLQWPMPVAGCGPGIVLSGSRRWHGLEGGRRPGPDRPAANAGRPCR